MYTQIQKFHSLTAEEIHKMYQLRVDVFVVEQNCPYHEVDDFDLQAYHAFLKDEDGTILAYCRILPPNTSFQTPAIGRVISTQRRKGYATQLLKEVIPFIQKEYQQDTITIEAQTYARKLYENIGFVQTSDPFLEDGIEHIQMQYHK